jgi:hypothetical protein
LGERANLSSAELTSDEIGNNTEGVEETKETDPLLALVGTLECDIPEIKKQLKTSVRPKIRVV